MVCLSIVSPEQNSLKKLCLLLLLPHLKLKRQQAILVLQIIAKLPHAKDPSVLLEACVIADKLGLLTGGKRRQQRSDQVLETLRSLGLYPGLRL